MKKPNLQPIKAEYAKVLKRIQDSIPKEWLDNLGHEELIAPTIKGYYEKIAGMKIIDLTQDLFKATVKDLVDDGAFKEGQQMPQEMIDTLMKESKERAKEVQRKAKIMLDSGELDKKMLVIDRKMEQKIDKYIDDEIQSAIRRGELPKGKKFRNLDKKIKKNLKK